jgi:hypothetical protein
MGCGMNYKEVHMSKSKEILNLLESGLGFESIIKHKDHYYAVIDIITTEDDSDLITAVDSNDDVHITLDSIENQSEYEEVNIDLLPEDRRIII